jgi:hypothetical protein
MYIPRFCNHRIESQSAPLRDRTISTLPSSVSQDMISLKFCLSIRKSSSVFWILRRREMALLTTSSFDVAKFSTLIPLWLLVLCKFFFPTFLFQNIFSPYIYIDISMRYFEHLSNTRSDPTENVNFVSSLSSSVGACTFRLITSNQRPLIIIHDLLLVTNSTLLTAGVISLC